MLKVTITKVLPLGGASKTEVKETKIILVQTDGIYDAFVQANKDEVVKLTQEVRDAHIHIHADKDQVQFDRNVVAQDKAIVAEDKAIVAEDKAIVRADRNVVATDKEIVAQDKAIVVNLRNETEDYASQALASKNAAASSETVAISEAVKSKVEADKSKSEADRAQSIADGININGGIVNGSLTVTDDIYEGDSKLSDKYASIPYVDKAIDDLKGGADGAYDTLKEIQNAIQNNEGGIGTITATLETKLSKSGGVMTGPIMFNDQHKYISFNGNDTWVGAVQGAVILESAINPLTAVAGQTHTIYHTGFKPTWNDVGGNDMFAIHDTHIKAMGDRWLKVGSEHVGLIPDAATVTGRGYLGTNSWWFADSYVARSHTQALCVGDTVSEFVINKVGNRLQFLV